VAVSEKMRVNEKLRLIESEAVLKFEPEGVREGETEVEDVDVRLTLREGLRDESINTSNVSISSGSFKTLCLKSLRQLRTL
jgi:hypothetical protein